jgi:hypothetical protein
VNCEGKLQYIHRSLAEYYVADFFVNQLTKGTKPSVQLQDHLLKDIFVKAGLSCNQIIYGWINVNVRAIGKCAKAVRKSDK